MNVQTAQKPQAVAEFAPSPPPAANIVPFTPQGEQKAYPPKIAKASARDHPGVRRRQGRQQDDPNGGWNTFHNYGYQKWEDVLSASSIAARSSTASSSSSRRWPRTAR
jgi:hypothetical protein